VIERKIAELQRERKLTIAAQLKVSEQQQAEAAAADQEA
jgi:hypothetical protein